MWPNQIISEGKAVVANYNRIFATVVTALLLTAACSEKTEVPPGGGVIDGIKYVNVRDEPQHRHEYENDLIRIYDVLLPPGYVTLYHAHIMDTIYVVVGGAKMRTKSLAGPSGIPIALPIPSGMVLWNEHTKEPLIHEVTNAGDDIARLVGVELKYEKEEFLRQPVVGRGLKLDDTYSKVRAYNLVLAPGESTGEMEAGFSGLIIALSEASVSLKTAGIKSRVASLEPASWEWLETPETITITNVGISPLEAVFYELP